MMRLRHVDPYGHTTTTSSLVLDDRVNRSRRPASEADHMRRDGPRDDTRFEDESSLPLDHKPCLNHGVLLTGVSADSDYLTGLLPAFLLAGIAIGLCAPSVQIGGLSGVPDEESGFAGGLVETMREIGGAAGVAAVSTVLVSRVGIDGFRGGFLVIAIAAALGSLTAGFAFARRASSSAEPALDVDTKSTDTAFEPALLTVPADRGEDNFTDRGAA
jgi:hypothetical protein